MWLQCPMALTIVLTFIIIRVLTSWCQPHAPGQNSHCLTPYLGQPHTPGQPSMFLTYFMDTVYILYTVVGFLGWNHLGWSVAISESIVLQCTLRWFHPRDLSKCGINCIWGPMKLDATVLVGTDKHEYIWFEVSWWFFLYLQGFHLVLLKEI